LIYKIICVALNNFTFSVDGKSTEPCMWLLWHDWQPSTDVVQCILFIRLRKKKLWWWCHHGETKFTILRQINVAQEQISDLNVARIIFVRIATVDD